MRGGVVLGVGVGVVGGGGLCWERVVREGCAWG